MSVDAGEKYCKIVHSSNFCICRLGKIFASWQLFARGQLGAGHQITKVCRLASFFIIRLANKYKYSYISVSDGMLVRGFTLTQHISLEGMTVLKWGLELARKAAAGCPSFAQRGIPIGCEPAQVIGWSLPLLWASLPSQADLIIYINNFSSGQTVSSGQWTPTHAPVKTNFFILISWAR